MAASAEEQADAKLVTIDDLRAAGERIKGLVHRTPLLTCSSIDKIATERYSGNAEGTAQAAFFAPPRIQLAFKAEHLQKVGAFKARGGTNAVRHLLEGLGDASASDLVVVTHSSGNHAAAIAFAARSVGAGAVIVMPKNAPSVKRAAVAGYGARIVLCEPDIAARQSTADQIMAEERAAGRSVHFVHPYDHEDVIAGQGTLGLEMLEQAQELIQSGVWTERPTGEPVLDIIVAPVGGGGMLSGVATAIKGTDPRILVVGAEPELASDAHASYTTGALHKALPPTSICDGLLTSLSPRTLAHLHARVDAIHLTTDAGALRALRLLWERAKQLVEPSAAVALAVLLEQQPGRSLAAAPKSARFEQTLQACRTAKRARGENADDLRIGIVLTGGNVEIAAVAKRLVEEEAESEKAKGA